MCIISQGDYAKALEWCQKAFAIQEKVLGKEHPLIATTYNNLAIGYSRQGDYPKALEWYQKACYVFIKTLGLEHPNTKTVLNNTYSAYIRSGKEKEVFWDWLKENLPQKTDK